MCLTPALRLPGLSQNRVKERGEMPSEVLLARVCKGLKRAASAFLPRELTPRSLTLTLVCTVTQAHLEVQT